MAHFFRPPGERISGRNVFLPVGETLSLGLWGCVEAPGKTLDIRLSNPSIANFDNILSWRRDGVIQEFRLGGVQMGRLKVEAVGSSGTVWDWIDVTVVKMETSVTFAPVTRVYQYVNQGKLSFINASDKLNFLAAYEGKTINGKTVHYSDELLQFLISLLDAGNLTVLSLYRFNQSMHGEIQQSGDVICRAVDIAAFQSVPITLDMPDRVIQAIVNVIDRMPAATYQIGFPRPGGHEKFDSSKDVFFPVLDKETAMKCWDGKIAMGSYQLLPKAKAAVVPALQRAQSRGAAFKAMYPDGLNHCCVFALPK